jgi:hypothetical protein
MDFKAYGNKLFGPNLNTVSVFTRWTDEKMRIHRTAGLWAEI